HFNPVFTQHGVASPGMGASYIFNDATPVTSEVYYRVQIVDHEYHNYSRVLLLSNKEIALTVSGLVNPFSYNITFNLTVPEDQNIQLGLYDSYGRILAVTQQAVYKGINHIEMRAPQGLQSGMYVLQVLCHGQMITRQMIKKVN